MWETVYLIFYGPSPGQWQMKEPYTPLNLEIQEWRRWMPPLGVFRDLFALGGAGSPRSIFEPWQSIKTEMTACSTFGKMGLSLFPAVFSLTPMWCGKQSGVFLGSKEWLEWDTESWKGPEVVMGSWLGNESVDSNVNSTVLIEKVAFLQTPTLEDASSFGTDCHRVHQHRGANTSLPMLTPYRVADGNNPKRKF